MEKTLLEAAITGSTSQLKDGHFVRALRDCNLKNNPVHVGAWLGHAKFVRELLELKPEFANELNSQGQTPLHLASAKGHVEVVNELLKVNSNVCFVSDRDGKTPFHEAAKKGRVKVLKKLHEAEPKGTRVLTADGQPILHVCVNHNQFEAMKVLLELELEKKDEFVNMKDENDNTILHILVAKDEYKVIKYLINDHTGVDVNIINVDGWTALDIATNTPSESDRLKIKGILRSVGAKTASKVSSDLKRWKGKNKVVNKNYQSWLSEMKQSLMVVAILMATITYQAGTNPPAGVFQDDGGQNVAEGDHEMGNAIMASKYIYKYFTFFNTTGLITSLSLILLLVSGLSFNTKISIWGFVIITWIAVASIIGSFICSFIILTPADVLSNHNFWLIVPVTFLIWVLLMFAVLGAHIFSWLRKIFYKLGIAHRCLRAMSCLFSKAGKLLTRSKEGHDDTTTKASGVDP